MFAGRMIGASSSSFLNTQPISFSIHDLKCANSMMMIYFNFLCFSISFLQKEEISNFFHYFFRMSLLIIANHLRCCFCKANCPESSFWRAKSYELFDWISMNFD